MPKIAIITDSDASLPADLAVEHHISLVPITVHFGEETFYSEVDINDRSLFERIDREGKLPTTAAPSPSAFAAAYRDAFDAGADSIVCITVSSKISGTYNSALTACDDFPGHKISVFDSLSLSMGQGFIAIAASEAAETGASHEEVIARAQSMSARHVIYGYLSTLKYLVMGGRVSKLSGGMANILDIRPVLTSKEGKLEMLEKVRTHRAALARVVALLAESAQGKILEKAAIVHVNNLEGANQLEAELRACLPMPEKVIIGEFSAGLSVHAGSGLVGAVLQFGPENS